MCVRCMLSAELVKKWFLRANLVNTPLKTLNNHILLQYFVLNVISMHNQCGTCSNMSVRCMFSAELVKKWVLRANSVITPLIYHILLQ